MRCGGRSTAAACRRQPPPPTPCRRQAAGVSRRPRSANEAVALSRERERHGGRRGSGDFERGSSTSTARLQLWSISTYQRCAGMPRHTSILTCPRICHPGPFSLCIQGGDALINGGRQGGQIKAPAAPLPSRGCCDGWCTRETRSSAFARSRLRSRSRSPWRRPESRGAVRERGVRGQGSGYGHPARLLTCPPRGERAAGTGFRHSRGFRARAHVSPHTLMEQLSAPK